MDEKKIDELLDSSDIPQPGEEKRKQSINLAMAEFDQAFSEKSSSASQGSFDLARLMGKLKQWSNPMNKKYIYGGLATACVAVLAISIQSQEEFSKHKVSQRLETKADLSESVVTSNQPAAAAVEQVAAAPEKSMLLQGKKMSAPMVKGKRERHIRQGAVAGFARSLDLEETYYQDVGRDKFKDFAENGILLVSSNPVSTFSSDVDTSSYAFIRSQLNNGVLPQKDAVRIEEMINYFDYDYPLPKSKAEPFQPSVSITQSPWAKGKKLIHIGIKGYDIEKSEKPNSNLVFLVDTSGSMNNPNKLPLLKKSLRMLVNNMSEDDSIALVTYAGSAGTELEPTKVKDKAKIFAALDKLGAGGSTAGAAGLRLAYQLAETSFDKNAVNRVLLATDGDFNVGITNPEEMQDFIERKRESGIFLSVLGFGAGNYNDQLMQTLAQNGNGVAAYIDTLKEAQKVLVEESSSTLFPIAKDVKFQVEFNPKRVAEYRLIGYETRALNREDFNNDAVDAGDIGARHTVTAIYEITEVGSDALSVDELRYQEKKDLGETKTSEYAFLKIRYKLPKEDKSKLITRAITSADETDKLSVDAGFATSVAGFGQLLKGGKYTDKYSYDDVIESAQNTKGKDTFGYRTEFIQLVRMAKSAS